MATGLTLPLEVVRRLYRMLHWYERQVEPRGTAGHRRGVAVPREWRRFRLKSTLTPGGTAEAYLLRWDDTEGEYVEDENTEFEVLDSEQRRHGIGLDDCTGDMQPSDGWAVQAMDRDAWEIVGLKERARLLLGTLAGAMATTDGTRTVDNLKSIDGGLLPVGSSGDTLTVYNWAAGEGDNDTNFWIGWNQANERWEFIQGPCAA
ncbi:MAG: hypothetical protein ACOY3P_03615 [Planctomycetota bacterium]